MSSFYDRHLFFNDARAVTYETCCYSVLEHIKDGSATASKFNSERIRFRTPNIVVVFSNKEPDIRQLSNDRWTVCNATKKGLTFQTERLLGNKRVSRFDREQDPDEKAAGIRHKIETKYGVHYPNS